MPIDVYQSSVDVLRDAQEHPLCYGVLGPIGWLFDNCKPGAVAPSAIPAPFISTPAAPRSIAEMTSNFWTPEEAMRLTWEKWNTNKENSIAQMKTGGMADMTPQGEETDLSFLWFVGGLTLMSVIVIRGIVK